VGTWLALVRFKIALYRLIALNRENGRWGQKKRALARVTSALCNNSNLQIPQGSPSFSTSAGRLKPETIFIMRNPEMSHKHRLIVPAFSVSAASENLDGLGVGADLACFCDFFSTTLTYLQKFQSNKDLHPSDERVALSSFRF